MLDKYDSFADLIRHETPGASYRIERCERAASAVLIVAPHGGSIESGTSELAALVAGEDHNLYIFEGLKPGGKHNGLHVTSHRFDDPDCVALAARCSIVIAIHGCVGASRIYVGGLDSELGSMLAQSLNRAGFPATAHGHPYPGRHPLNICNRGSRRRGVQLEFSVDFREPPLLEEVAAVVRGALARYLATNQP